MITPSFKHSMIWQTIVVMFYIWFSTWGGKPKFNMLEPLFFILHKRYATIGCAFMVTRDDQEIVEQHVKDQCKSATKGIIYELESCFLAHEFMKAIWIIYPQYWEAFDVKSMFANHLAILKTLLCHPKPLDQMAPWLLNCQIKYCSTDKYFSLLYE